MSYRNIAIDALSKCTAFDPYMPSPSESTIQAWSELFAEERVDNVADVLRAVTLVYREKGDPGFRVTPKIVCEYTHQVRKERLAKEAADAEKAAALEGPEKITLAEFQRRHGGAFPSFDTIGKRVPRG